jgi:hypothetical protein
MMLKMNRTMLCQALTMKVGTLVLGVSKTATRSSNKQPEVEAPNMTEAPSKNLGQRKVTNL